MTFAKKLRRLKNANHEGKKIARKCYPQLNLVMIQFVQGVLYCVGILLVIITKDNGVRATTIEGQNVVLCVGFTKQIVRTHVITLRGLEGRDARDQIAFCAFHSFLVEVQTDAGEIHATHA